MTTAFFTSQRFDLHTLSGHPEHAGRLQAVRAKLQETGVWDALHHVEAIPATQEQLLRIHTPLYLDLLNKLSQMEHGTHIGADTYFFPESYELAKLAAGGVIAVVDAVMKKETHNGIAAIRPPGHHATPQTAMGFCLLSNIAIAARYAYETYQLERVAIVDFDVHHGNGTQDALYDNPQVLFISSHQSPFYPGTGALGDIGQGAGHGFTVNAPLPAGTGDQGIQILYEAALLPALKRYEPQLILVSAGFDAHWRDPLASLRVSLTGFDWLCRELIEIAKNVCDGKIVFVMEGGYDLEVLSYGWLNIANGLLGDPDVQDPMGKAKQDPTLSTDLLKKIKQLHNLG